MPCCDGAGKILAQADRPGVSVVIPAYNNAGTLAEAVASVREQKWENLEIVVVDDGSTDETTHLLDELAGSDLRVVRQPNRGPSAARNAGIGLACREWIAFLDADDTWLPGKLRAQFGVLDASDGDFCFCGTLLDAGEGVAALPRPARPDDGTLGRLVWGNRFAPSTVVVRRAALEKVGLFDDSMRISEDWDLWLRLAVASKGCCVPDPFVVMRASVWSDKYRMEAYEAATVAAISRLYTSLERSGAAIPASRSRRRVLSWHLAVLAKSYLRNRRTGDFLRCGIRCVITHHEGSKYLLKIGKPDV